MRSASAAPSACIAACGEWSIVVADLYATQRIVCFAKHALTAAELWDPSYLRFPRGSFSGPYLQRIATPAQRELGCATRDPQPDLRTKTRIDRPRRWCRLRPSREVRLVTQTYSTAQNPMRENSRQTIARLRAGVGNPKSRAMRQCLSSSSYHARTAHIRRPSTRDLIQAPTRGRERTDRPATARTPARFSMPGRRPRSAPALHRGLRYPCGHKKVALLARRGGSVNGISPWRRASARSSGRGVGPRRRAGGEHSPGVSSG